MVKLSIKGKKLIKMYKEMHKSGFKRTDGHFVYPAYENFNIKRYRTTIKPYLDDLNIKSLLDYGSGGSDWYENGFDKDSNKSAAEYFNLDKVYRYEPGRDIDERRRVDCVISFDTLEHIYINDIKEILFDIFSYAKKLVIINVSVLPAKALLPNGENAHVTVRHPMWWKGVLDILSMEYKHVEIFLLVNLKPNKAEFFRLWSGADRDKSDSFVIDLEI